MASGVPRGLDPEGVKIAMGGGKHWGPNDQRRYDEWARRNGKSSGNTRSASQSSSGVPRGLDPEGVKIAMGGGKHWGASDQKRYDEWARRNGKSSGNTSSSPKSSSGVPKGLDPEGVKIAMGGGKHWGANDQRRYDEWARRNGKSSSSSSNRTPSAAPRPAPKSSANSASTSRSVKLSGGAEKGMFGLEGIMKNFYDYKPSSDDEYGNYVKNTFASNMIQSAFDTQNAKDLAYAQGEIASAQMTQAADLQRLNTQAIMRKEYQYGTDMMKQQFQYQSQFADDQHSRDLGMMSAMAKKSARRQLSSKPPIKRSLLVAMTRTSISPTTHWQVRSTPLITHWQVRSTPLITHWQARSTPPIKTWLASRTPTKPALRTFV